MQDPTPDVSIFQTYNTRGDKHWIQWVDYGITDAAGTVTEIQAIGRDITPLVQTQHRLRDREEMLSTLFKSIPVLLIQFSDQGQFQYVNTHWVEVLGWTGEEMRENPAFWNQLYPDLSTRQAVLQHMKGCHDEWQDFRTICRDGNPLEISWASFCLSDGRRLAIGVDVTQRKRIEQKLQQSAEKYRNLVETAHDLIWSVDAEGRITFINQASQRIYGLMPDEMLSRLYKDFVPEEQMAINDASWQTAIDNNDRLSNFENWVYDKDGHKRLLNTNVVLTRDEAGNISGSMGTAQDITHRIELENQRIYANKLESELEKEKELIKIKDQFASLISHEFRTPIAVINTSVDLIIRYFSRLSSDRILEKLVMIQKQIQSMVNLMENTLKYSRSEAGSTKFEPESVDVLALCQQVIETLKIIDTGNHQIILEADEGFLRADPNLLEHILSNLLSNALKYSSDNNTVTVRVIQQTDRWQFEVVDEGIGIPDDDVSKLFAPFHRASNASTVQGTGLGLAIVKDYVERHNGNIIVETKLGVGTKFIFTVPTNQ